VDFGTWCQPGWRTFEELVGLFFENFGLLGLLCRNSDVVFVLAAHFCNHIDTPSLRKSPKIVVICQFSLVLGIGNEWQRLFEKLRRHRRVDNDFRCQRDEDILSKF
jgi:hypothetical protein